MANEISNTLNIDNLFIDVKQIIDEGRKQGRVLMQSALLFV